MLLRRWKTKNVRSLRCWCQPCKSLHSLESFWRKTCNILRSAELFRIRAAHLDCLKSGFKAWQIWRVVIFSPLEGRCSEEEGTGRTGHRELHKEMYVMFRLTWKTRAIGASISRWDPHEEPVLSRVDAIRVPYCSIFFWTEDTAEEVLTVLFILILSVPDIHLFERSWMTRGRGRKGNAQEGGKTSTLWPYSPNFEQRMHFLHTPTLWCTLCGHIMLRNTLKAWSVKSFFHT